MSIVLGIIQKIKNNWIILAILLIAFALRFVVLLNLGEMYDEYPVAGNGKIYWGGIKNFDFSSEIWHINYEHPPIAKLIFGLPAVIQEKLPFINSLFDSEFHPDKRYFLARITSNLIGCLTILVVYLISKRWFNKKIAAYAALFLALMPHFLVHNSIAGIETPQALISSLFVYIYVKSIESFDPKSNHWMLYFSYILLGLFFLTKFSALFYLAFLPLPILLFNKSLIKSPKFIKASIFGFFICLLTIYAFWPWLWPNPFNIVKSFSFFKNAATGEYFFGSTNQPPIYYYFVYLIATTPPVILLLSAWTALIYFVKNLFIYNIKISLIKINLPLNRKYLAVTLIWLTIPFLISILGIKKDGIRYVYTYFPPLAILAAVGFYSVLEYIHNKKIKYIVLYFSFFSIIWPLVMFYPYYLDYYNYFVGGTENVYRNKRLDYNWWGEGIKEAVLYINKTYQNKAVYPILKPGHTSPLYKEGLQILDEYDVNVLHISPDVIIITENYFYHDRVPEIVNKYKLIKTIDVNEIPLVRIYEKS